MNENIDLKVANTLAAELGNENLQLRQVIIRLRLEVESLRKQEETVEDEE